MSPRKITRTVLRFKKVIACARLSNSGPTVTNLPQVITQPKSEFWPRIAAFFLEGFELRFELSDLKILVMGVPVYICKLVEYIVKTSFLVKSHQYYPIEFCFWIMFQYSVLSAFFSFQIFFSFFVFKKVPCSRHGCKYFKVLNKFWFYFLHFSQLDVVAIFQISFSKHHYACFLFTLLNV